MLTRRSTAATGCGSRAPAFSTSTFAATRPWPSPKSTTRMARTCAAGCRSSRTFRASTFMSRGRRLLPTRRRPSASSASTTRSPAARCPRGRPMAMVAAVGALVMLAGWAGAFWPASWARAFSPAAQRQPWRAGTAKAARESHQLSRQSQRQQGHVASHRGSSSCSACRKCSRPGEAGAFRAWWQSCCTPTA